MTKWIKRSEKLPELYKRVMVYRANYEGDEEDKMHVGFLQHKDGFYSSSWGLLDDELFPHTLVTHWAELSEPPEELSYG